MSKLSATPFHDRTATTGGANVWTASGGFTVPAHYGDASAEALAAHVSAILADISPREDLRVDGPGAVAMLSAAFGADIGALVANASMRVRWCADGGGLRGEGVLVRLGPADFLLRSVDADLGWFAGAAPRFDASVHDATSERGLLLIAGPFALPVLAAAGLADAAMLQAGHHAPYDWQGLSVTLFRRESGHAYQLSCAVEDGPAVFDRLVKRGSLFALRLAGETALDTLALERGVALPGRDWQPAREGFAREPKPVSFMGVVLDSDAPTPFSPVFRDGVEVGRSLRSAYSPALRRAIALARIADIAAGTNVTVHHAQEGRARDVAGRIVALPFL